MGAHLLSPNIFLERGGALSGLKNDLIRKPCSSKSQAFSGVFLKIGFLSNFDRISAAHVYGLLFVKVDFLLISLLEAMPDKPENMNHLKFGRVKVNKGKVLPHNAQNVDT